MTGTTRVVAVTGAAGFLGRHLVHRLREREWEVRALARRPEALDPAPAGVRIARCDLPDAIDESALSGVDTVVHAAWATREIDPHQLERANLEGAKRLRDMAHHAGARRVVFISTVAAAADAPNHYGRMKHAAEQLFDPARDLVVRPGTILARGGGGIFGLMRDLMRRLHVVPLFGGGRQPLQTVHVDDLCEAIVRAVERDLTGTLNVAEPEPLSFATVLRMTAERSGVRCLFVPLPFQPFLGALRAAERAGVPVPLRSESLLGMKGLRAVPVAGDLARVGVRVRPVTESLADVL